MERSRFVLQLTASGQLTILICLPPGTLHWQQYHNHTLTTRNIAIETGMYAVPVPQSHNKQQIITASKNVVSCHDHHRCSDFTADALVRSIHTCEYAPGTCSSSAASRTKHPAFRVKHWTDITSVPYHLACGRIWYRCHTQGAILLDSSL